MSAGRKLLRYDDLVDDQRPSPHQPAWQPRPARYPRPPPQVWHAAAQQASNVAPQLDAPHHTSKKRKQSHGLASSSRGVWNPAASGGDRGVTAAQSNASGQQGHWPQSQELTRHSQHHHEQQQQRQQQDQPFVQHVPSGSQTPNPRSVPRHAQSKPVSASAKRSHIASIAHSSPATGFRFTAHAEALRGPVDDEHDSDGQAEKQDKKVSTVTTVSTSCAAMEPTAAIPPHVAPLAAATDEPGLPEWLLPWKDPAQSVEPGLAGWEPSPFHVSTESESGRESESEETGPIEREALDPEVADEQASEEEENEVAKSLLTQQSDPPTAETAERGNAPLVADAGAPAEAMVEQTRDFESSDEQNAPHMVGAIGAEERQVEDWEAAPGHEEAEELEEEAEGWVEGYEWYNEEWEAEMLGDNANAGVASAVKALLAAGSTASGSDEDVMEVSAEERDSHGKVIRPLGHDELWADDAMTQAYTAAIDQFTQFHQLCANGAETTTEHAPTTPSTFAQSALWYDAPPPDSRAARGTRKAGDASAKARKAESKLARRTAQEEKVAARKEAKRLAVEQKARYAQAQEEMQSMVEAPAQPQREGKQSTAVTPHLDPAKAMPSASNDASVKNPRYKAKG